MSAQHSYIFKTDLDQFLEAFLGVWELYVGDVDNLLDVFLSLPVDLLPFTGFARKQLDNLGVVTVNDIFLYVPPITRILFEIRHHTQLALHRLIELYEARRSFVRASEDYSVAGYGPTFDFIIKRAKNNIESYSFREEI